MIDRKTRALQIMAQTLASKNKPAAPVAPPMPDALTNTRNMYAGQPFDIYGQKYQMQQRTEQPIAQPTTQPTINAPQIMPPVNTSMAMTTPEITDKSSGLSTIVEISRGASQIAATPLILGEKLAHPKDFKNITYKELTVDSLKEGMKYIKGEQDFRAGIEKAGQIYLKKRGFDKEKDFYKAIQKLNALDIVALSLLNGFDWFGDPTIMLPGLKGLKEFATWKRILRTTGKLKIPAGARFVSKEGKVATMLDDFTGFTKGATSRDIPINDNFKIRFKTEKGTNQLILKGYMRRGIKPGEIKDPQLLLDDMIKETGNTGLKLWISGDDVIIGVPKQLYAPATRILLPEGISQRPIVPPTTSTQVGFQMVNATKQAEITKVKDLLIKALNDKRKIIESGRADDKTKAQFKKLSGVVATLDNQLTGMAGQQNIVSGPVTRPAVSAPVAPVTTPTAPAVTTPTRQAPTKAIARSASVSHSKGTKAEIIRNIENIKDAISPSVYNKAKEMISRNIAPTFIVDKKHNITGVEDKGVVIKGEAPIIKELKSLAVTKIKKVIPVKEVSISRRKLAIQKREILATKKSEEKTRLTEIRKAKAIAESKPQSYQEYLARAEAQKAAAKPKAEVVQKKDALKKYLLERKIQQSIKGGEMTLEQAAKARASGKYNVAKNEIDYDAAKKNNSIFAAEKVDILKSDEEYKLEELGYRLFKKYNKILAQKSGIASEKHLPRGTKGAAYESGTIVVNSYGNISTVVQEIAHQIDRVSGLRGKIIDLKVIKELEDIYSKYYLAKDLPFESARKNVIRKITEKDKPEAIIEGLSTFIQNYAFNSGVIKIEYPALVKEFLNKDGLYYNPIFNMLIDDTRNILGSFQGLDSLGKIKTLVSSKPLDINVEKFYNTSDIIKAFMLDTAWYLEKLAVETGLERTVADPSQWMRSWQRVSNILLNNIAPSKRAPYFKLTEDGSWIDQKRGYNLGTMQLSLKSELNRNNYDAYMYSQDTYHNYIELKNDKVLYANDKIKISEKQQQYESEPDNVVLFTEIQHLKKFNEQLKEYIISKEAMLTKRGIPFEIAEDAYKMNKEKYVEQDKMFAAIQRDQLDTLFLARKMTPDFYNYLKSRKGHAPANTYFIDELAGMPELNDYFINLSPNISRGGKKLGMLETRTGSQKLIVSPTKQLIINDAKVNSAALQQITINKLWEISNKLPDYVVREVPYSIGMEGQTNIKIAIDENFKKHAIEIDKHLVSTFNDVFSPKQITVLGKIWEGLAIPSRLFAASTTGIRLSFAIVNLPVDALSNLVVSKNKMIPIIDSFRHSIDLLRKDPETKEYVQEWYDLGGPGTTLYGELTAPKTVEDAYDLLKKKNFGAKIKTVAQVVTYGLSFPSRITETLGRLTEHINSRKLGNPQMIAFEDSIRISGPYVHGGFIKPVIKPAVYINAGLQHLGNTIEVFSRMSRQLKGAKNERDRSNVIGRFLFLTAAFLATGLTEIYLLKKAYDNAKTDEEKAEASKNIIDYNNISAWSRINNLRSSFLNPEWLDKPFSVRIPSNLAFISNAIAMIAADKYLNSNFTAKEYAELAVESSPVDLNPFSWGPWILVQLGALQMGFKTFPKLRRFENDYMKYLPSEERYHGGTNELAKWLGDTSLAKSMDLSPVKIEQYIKLGGGGIWQFLGEWKMDKNPLVNMFNSLISSLENTLLGGKDYLFIGRGFEKFYADRGQLQNDVTQSKKTYGVVKDNNLKLETLKKMKRLEIYNAVATLMTRIRKIDSVGITVPKQYNNTIYNIIDNLNNNQDDAAIKAIRGLNNAPDFSQFINNSERIVEQKKIEDIKNKFNREQSLNDLFIIREAKAAMVPLGHYPEKRELLPGETEYNLTTGEIKYRQSTIIDGEPQLTNNWVQAVYGAESSLGTDKSREKKDAGKYGWLVGFLPATYNGIKENAKQEADYKKRTGRILNGNRYTKLFSKLNFDTKENAFKSAVEFANFRNTRWNAKGEPIGKKYTDLVDIYVELYNASGKGRVAAKRNFLRYWKK